jgi:hypothetical protein
METIRVNRASYDRSTPSTGAHPLPRSVPGSEDAGTNRELPVAMSTIIAALATLASAVGLFIPGLYRDVPLWAAQARGTDLVTLTIAVPTLAISLILVARGSLRARIVWLGVVGYILYMYTIAAFTLVFNPLFLVYVALLSLSLWSLVLGVSRTDPGAVGVQTGHKRLARMVAVYLLVVAALFTLAWLKDILPAIAGDTSPASLKGMRLPTNPVHVLDLSVLLPLAALSGAWLLRKRAWGHLLAGILLTTLTIVGVSVMSGMVFEYLQDRSISLAPLPMLAVVTLVGLWLLVAYVRRLSGSTAGQASNAGRERSRTGTSVKRVRRTV